MHQVRKYPEDREMSDLLGLTFSSVTQIEEDGGDRIVFTSTDGRHFGMYRFQDCCESVYIESITGDLSDLVESPLLRAEKSVSEDDPVDWKAPEWREDCHLWTFYKFATRKGYVDIRWYGESNGYYSVGVELREFFD